jgi:hypothetical protein
VESDREYFARRANDERAAASVATHHTAELAHLALSERYEELALAIARREYALGLDLDAADWPSLGVQPTVGASTPDQPHSSPEAGPRSRVSR